MNNTTENITATANNITVDDLFGMVEIPDVDINPQPVDNPVQAIIDLGGWLKDTVLNAWYGWETPVGAALVAWDVNMALFVFWVLAWAIIAIVIMWFNWKSSASLGLGKFFGFSIIWWLMFVVLIVIHMMIKTYGGG